VKNWLTINEAGKQQRRLLLSGNYIIGRLQRRCSEAAQAFEEAPMILIFDSCRHLSSLHCVLLRTGDSYEIIDGWGEYFSTNGVQINGFRVEFAILKNDDLIHLGCSDVTLRYEIETDVEEEDKATLSQVFEV
jgi:pSer/pThr/pTyr-binding forkhead associated (FHA) protein